ncbi:PREDICTED: uncharacterized protein LOC109351828 isoform X1 [Lupinus angustifolius]|uniref:uncharacterized protein LOC109351828 isoform X1 n=1 Tax=Lupinus angustifolius TaxID=3871 RepID=UPI00092EA50D|nr:PREDICTED: uncharacterized protein LOC109351828 isoform X1 [Lupinus angustifolius]
MAENKRENQRRKRRILEQGSDRLAFITGRISSLPPQTLSSSISDDSNVTSPTISPQGVAVEELDSTLLKNDDPLVADLYPFEASRTITQTQPLQEHEGGTIQTSEFDHVQQPPSDSSVGNVSNQQPQQQPRTEESKLFIIPSEISSAINASRSTRLCCSVTVALLVVVSYLGFSLLGSELIKSLISFRPLYLVLVTNLTVVFAKLLSTKNIRRYAISSGGDQGDAQLVRALEFGLVLQNVVDAFFMDCSVYAIVVVCGLSLVQR